MSRLLYIPRKILMGGYGLLYNWFCTQDQLVSVKYGYLYNWYAIEDSRKVASLGWHIPNNADWTTLQLFLTEPLAGKKLKEAGTLYWGSVVNEGTNEVGFNGRRTSIRSGVNGTFINFTNYGYMASSTISGSNRYTIVLTTSNNSLTVPSSSATDLQNGQAIRLLKDSITLSHGQTGTYVGNDGKVYTTICIGTQEWVAQNLMETRYRDGSLIPEVTDNSAWAALTTGARCSYNNVESNAGTTKRLAPSGWHVPNKAEIDTMLSFLGGASTASLLLKESGTAHWYTDNGSTNSTNFTFRGNGWRSDSDGIFYAITKSGHMWSCTPYAPTPNVSAYRYDMSHNTTIVSLAVRKLKEGSGIRLIKDTSDWTAGETLTDADGNVYQTVKIGDQVWLASNWKCKKWNDGSDIPNITSNAAWAAATTPAWSVYDNNLLNI